jgi:hypothetical protein
MDATLKHEDRMYRNIPYLDERCSNFVKWHECVIRSAGENNAKEVLLGVIPCPTKPIKPEPRAIPPEPKGGNDEKAMWKWEIEHGKILEFEKVDNEVYQSELDKYKKWKTADNEMHYLISMTICDHHSQLLRVECTSHELFEAVKSRFEVKHDLYQFNTYKKWCQIKSSDYPTIREFLDEFDSLLAEMTLADMEPTAKMLSMHFINAIEETHPKFAVRWRAELRRGRFPLYESMEAQLAGVSQPFDLVANHVTRAKNPNKRKRTS